MMRRPMAGLYAILDVPHPHGLAVLEQLAAILAGAGAMIEMIYHLQLNAALGPEMKFMGATLNSQRFDTWFGAGFVLVTGIALFELTRREFVRQWVRVQEEVEKEIKRRELL